MMLKSASAMLYDIQESILSTILQEKKAHPDLVLPYQALEGQQVYQVFQELPVIPEIVDCRELMEPKE